MAKYLVDLTTVSVCTVEIDADDISDLEQKLESIDLDRLAEEQTQWEQDCCTVDDYRFYSE